MSQATRAQILAHLQVCSGQFRPPLADRVDLPTYAEKLFKHATTFEAWHQETLIGLVAAYLDQASQPAKAFVSNVSVLPNYQSHGIGQRLMIQCNDEAVCRGIQTVSLEVSSENLAAIELYSKLGYIPSAKLGMNLSMQLELGKDR